MTDGRALPRTVMLKRAPGPALRPYVECFWASERTPGPASMDRERVLPTGTMHLAVSLTSGPFRLFADAGELAGDAVGRAVVGGPRSRPYLRDLSGPSRTAGVQFLPGACELLFGVGADELAERHTPLDDLWGRSASIVHERLIDAGTPGQALDILEAAVAARLPAMRGLHPAVAHALERFTLRADVRDVVRQTGYSHRRFVALFHRSVGLTPKRYCRVRRFRRVLQCIAADRGTSWAGHAQDAGYCDQSHFNREFREFAGITPGDYRSIAPVRPHHVPMTER